MFHWLFKGGRKPDPGFSERQPQRLDDRQNEDSVGVCTPAIEIALKYHQAGRLSEADAAYRDVLAVNPDHTDALHLSGLVAFQTGNYGKAELLISRALSLDSAYPAARNNLGNVFRAQGRLDEAFACFQNAVELDPGCVDAHVNMGMLLKGQGRLDVALYCFEKVVSLTPDAPNAHLNLGNLYEAQGKRIEALTCYRKALELNPDFFEAQFNLGNVLRNLGDLNETVACYRKALAIAPNSAITCINLGNVLRDQGEVDEAIAFYEKAIELAPNIPEAHLNLGNTLVDQTKAAACYRKALELKPDLAEAHYGLGNALMYQGKLDEAIACYSETLALKPDLAEAHYALGNALRDEDRLQEALGCYRKALECHSGYAEARWAIAMLQIPAVYESKDKPAHCRVAFSKALDELDHWFDAARIADGFKAVGTKQPFCLAYQEQDNRELLQRYGALCARIMADWFDQQNFPRIKKRDNDRLIRVGVVSQYFQNHSIWNAIAKGWFQQLNRNRFALHAFYLGPHQDQETHFAKANAAYFTQGHRGLRQWVEAIIGQQLDVLIYPEIGMDPMTARLANLRLAPVQIAAWGHPETTGFQTIDYYLSAQFLEPENAQRNYTEKLVALPNLGCFYKPVPVMATAPDLGAIKLDSDTPLLLCPGVPFKYAPEHDWVLVEIARRLGRCKLVFFTYRLNKISEKLRSRLVAVFARGGLDFERFAVFIPWQSSARFYGLMKRADVFLDTIGFSGFNTAIQAVECGIPIVSREGRFMRGRLASGILKRMGLPELVAETEEEYVALAVRLVQDVVYRSHIRERIEISRQILFEDVAPIRAMEDFLAEVATRH